MNLAQRYVKAWIAYFELVQSGLQADKNWTKALQRSIALQYDTIKQLERELLRSPIFSREREE